MRDQQKTSMKIYREILFASRDIQVTRITKVKFYFFLNMNEENNP